MTSDFPPAAADSLREAEPRALAVAADPKIWEQHPVPTRHQELLFKQFFQDALASKGALIAIDGSLVE